MRTSSNISKCKIVYQKVMVDKLSVLLENYKVRLRVFLWKFFCLNNLWKSLHKYLNLKVKNCSHFENAIFF